jgi:hydroxypyruvate reductase
MPPPEPRQLLRSLFDAAVASAQPQRVLAGYLPPPPRGRTLVLGAGKAAAAMAAAVEAAWPPRAPLHGLVVTRYGSAPADAGAGRIEIVEAAHPVPDAAGEAAARRMLAMARGLRPDDLVIALISGGASALLPLPAPGLSLAEKQEVSRALLRCGATIAEMNCVRKHLSAIKGGRLAAACAPAPVLTLLISDVPGDDPAVIASGPTVPDPSTCADALAVLQRYRIEVSAAALAGLRSGAFETPKPDPATPNSVRCIATPRQMLEAAARAARAAGCAAHVLADDMEGEARDIALAHAAIARQIARNDQPFARPCVLLSGGETTVRIDPRQPCGRGGRNTEFLLALALALRGEPGVWALAADTDGIDGSEDNAGAWLGPDLLQRAAGLGLDARACLDAHDAWSLFAATGDLLVTGPTSTNVNDFRALLIA